MVAVTVVWTADWWVAQKVALKADMQVASTAVLMVEAWAVWLAELKAAWMVMLSAEYLAEQLVDEMVASKVEY